MVQGRKVRFDLTPLEADALQAVAEEALGTAKAWERMAAKRGPGPLAAALRRAVARLAEARRQA